jgi:hypothetical protein
VNSPSLFFDAPSKKPKHLLLGASYIQRGARRASSREMMRSTTGNKSTTIFSFLYLRVTGIGEIGSEMERKAQKRLVVDCVHTFCLLDLLLSFSS